jgi:hypothetical protein
MPVLQSVATRGETATTHNARHQHTSVFSMSLRECAQSSWVSLITKSAIFLPNLTKATVSIVDQISRRLIQRERFTELLGRPGGEV